MNLITREKELTTEKQFIFEEKIFDIGLIVSDDIDFTQGAYLSYKYFDSTIEAQLSNFKRMTLDNCEFELSFCAKKHQQENLTFNNYSINFLVIQFTMTASNISIIKIPSFFSKNLKTKNYVYNLKLEKIKEKVPELILFLHELIDAQNFRAELKEHLIFCQKNSELILKHSLTKLRDRIDLYLASK